MASTRYGTKDSNPFLDDEDEVDDSTFLSHPKQGSSGYMLVNQWSDSRPKPNNDSFEQRRKQLLDETREIEERTLQSSYASLGLLHETEKIGIETAEELVNQGEKLHNIEEKVDEINNTMRLSQKHLNAMKSVFGNIKSFWSRSGSTNSSSSASSPLVQPSKGSAKAPHLQDTVSKIKQESTSASMENHPAFRSRGIDTSGFGSSGWGDDHFGYDDRTALKTSSEFADDNGYSTRTREVDERLNKNLEDMSLGLGRIKKLALGLGEEIDDQNEMLERINRKTADADDTLHHQERQIRRILKK